MKTSTKKISISIVTILAFVCLLIPQTTRASQIPVMELFIQTVNASINTDNNEISISGGEVAEFTKTHEAELLSLFADQGKDIEMITTQLESSIHNANALLSTNYYRITDTGRILPIGADRANFDLQWFWWGTRRTFYSDKEAYNFAYEMDRAAATSGAFAVSGFLFPGMGVIGGISTAYATAVASSVRWAADQPGNGIVLDTTYALTYTCNPRK